MADEIHVSVVTADGTAFEQNTSCVNLPTGGGSVGVLADHAPMLCAISAGVVRCTAADGSAVHVTVGEGIASVADNEVVLLVSEAQTTE